MTPRRTRERREHRRDLNRGGYDRQRDVERGRAGWNVPGLIRLVEARTAAGVGFRPSAGPGLGSRFARATMSTASRSGCSHRTACPVPSYVTSRDPAMAVASASWSLRARNSSRSPHRMSVGAVIPRSLDGTASSRPSSVSSQTRAGTLRFSPISVSRKAGGRGRNTLLSWLALTTRRSTEAVERRSEPVARGPAWRSRTPPSCRRTPCRPSG
jgi:hypothetical protein